MSNQDSLASYIGFHFKTTYQADLAYLIHFKLVFHC